MPHEQSVTPSAPYLQGLNPPQRQAVETLDGPVLILAGAGTGKTRALTARVAHLLQTGTATPGQILAVTFTNKAANELRHRVSGLLGGIDVAGWWIGTFHSLAARMLRRHAELVGLRSNFTIIDDDDQLRLLKQVLELQGVDSKTINPKLILGIIDKWKNMGLTPDRVPNFNAGELPQPLTGPQLMAIYRNFQERLVTLNACDFGDLLLHLVTIFRDPANGVLAQYHARYTHILVDEYQDTNTIQYQWLHLLSQARHNLCCVGDDDQSIYSWRGADVSNILNFEKDFPEATIIRLEQNYRSTKPILAAANGLIAHNKGRLGKNLWTEEHSDDLVQITVTMDQSDEARFVAEQIESVQRKNVSLDEIAVLVRASSQMRAFEERFNTFGISYRVIGGPRFYERQEIRDALGYFRLINQHNDDLAFERIVNVPKRGLGAKTISDLQIAARRLQRPLFPAVEYLIQTDELKTGPRLTLTKFVGDIHRWLGLVATMSLRDWAAKVLEESGYVAMWRDDKSIEAAGRLDNLKELVSAMSNFDSLGAFLEHVALVMENQERKEEPRVTLMTLHAAKGLEYAHVFLPGWEEGLFPNQRSMDDSGLAGLEEERRLAYVGITRAKHKATITYALRRQTYGEYTDTVPSRFIEELPGDTVSDERQKMKNVWAQGGLGAAVSTQRWGGGTPNWGQKKWSPQPKTPLVIDADIVVVNPSSAFRVGQRVFHEKFGYGKVTDIDDDKLDVSFEKAGTKKVLDRFVNIVEK
ncbi:MAG: ATP-dependent helicase UvrD/PcrA [Alphaproteobacteria bacterium]|nr:ATP-dependent helicase UvrD/PcrA [Alphaproteobacteria bacterium]